MHSPMLYCRKVYGSDTKMRTRQSICLAKKRYVDRAAADAIAAQYTYQVRAYLCDRCLSWHLTSRLKGKRRPKPGGDVSPSE